MAPAVRRGVWVRGSPAEAGRRSCWDTSAAGGCRRSCFPGLRIVLSWPSTRRGTARAIKMGQARHDRAKLLSQVLRAEYLGAVTESQQPPPELQGIRDGRPKQHSAVGLNLQTLGLGELAFGEMHRGVGGEEGLQRDAGSRQGVREELVPLHVGVEVEAGL